MMPAPVSHAGSACADGRRLRLGARAATVRGGMSAAAARSRPSPAAARLRRRPRAPAEPRSPRRAPRRRPSAQRGARRRRPRPAEGGEPADYTRIPGELDRKLEALDEDGALRATIINPGDVWTRSAQKGLLGARSSASLSSREQKDEKHKAFDLLDALSKSGALAIEDASLHVVIAATHGFDRTLLDTVIQDNVNPIEKVERSLMILGTTIHGRPAAELLAEGQRERFFATSPRLGLAALTARDPSPASDRGDPGSASMP